MVNHLIGFGVGGASTFPPTYAFVDAVHDLPANQDPQSQNLDWGDEPAAGHTRHLIIGLAFVTSSGVAPNSVTVGGDAATLVVAQAPPGAITVGQAIYIIEKPTGTSGTIAFGVASGDIDGGMISVWAAYDLSSPLAVDTAAVAAFGAGVSDISLNTSDDGAVFAVTSVSNTITQSANWVGVTEDTANETTNDQQWAASAFNVAQETPRTVQVSRGATFSMSAVAASFR